MTSSSSLHSLLASPQFREKVERELASRSFREFVRQAWHVVEPSTVFVPGWHIDAICDHLEAVTRGEIRNLLINVPPRHMKSLLVSVFWPAWEWIAHPERRWLCSSYAASLSTRDSIQCRRLIESPWYRARWGHVFSLTGDQNAKTRFDNSRSGYRLSTSVGGRVTGEGGDRIVCDDPHKVDEVESDTVRKTAIDWWDIAMSTRVNERNGDRHAALSPEGLEWAPPGERQLRASLPSGRVRRANARDVDRILRSAHRNW